MTEPSVNQIDAIPVTENEIQKDAKKDREFQDLYNTIRAGNGHFETLGSIFKGRSSEDVLDALEHIDFVSLESTTSIAERFSYKTPRTSQIVAPSPGSRTIRLTDQFCTQGTSGKHRILALSRMYFT
ncbi:hypothetical protein JTB14_010871 [Gonioctena quinquepunctata]|nr:hypothetical protein JTB14_010871 [Gonioctena quinquepunctata]